jgi:serpin B
VATLPEPARERIAISTTTFSLDLLDQLWQQPGNLLVSPYSLYAALLMVASGAGGETAAVLGQVLRLDAAGSDLKAFTSHSARLTAETGGSQLVMGQSIWPAERFTLQPAFRQTMATNFGASITPLNYAGDPQGAAQRINDWVSERTRGKIKELVAADQFSPDTRLSLLSTIWFKGEWKNEFYPESTRTGPFVLQGGGTSSVPLMHKVGWYRLGVIPGGRILEIPYQGQSYDTTNHSLLILLPDKHDGLAALQRQLTPQSLKKAIEGMKEERVELILPRFKMKGRPDLMEPLERMGLDAVFGPSADLSGISAVPDLYLSSVVQQAMLEVDEKGTEAAAATLMMMPVTGLSEDPITPFRVDHPFLLMIRDQPTGTLLFLGRVMDPGEQG